MRRPWAPLLGGAFITLAAAAMAAQAAPPRTSAEAPVPGLTYSLSKVAPGVWCAVAHGVPYYVSNSVVIAGDDAVVLVDSGAGTREARVLRDAIREVTPLPVRYIVDTHFHFDHAFGNGAFPEALAVAHEATRAGLALGLRQPTVARNLAALPGRVAELRSRAEREGDAAKRAALLGEATALDAYRRELAAHPPDPPALTFSDRLTLWLGSREVRVLHLGRGHTAGDTVVYLPRERVVCTGDLFNGYIGYMGDAFVDEWADTLGRLAELDFDTAIPGHGEPFRGKDAIGPVQACLRDLWSQARALREAGVSPEEAAARIDLTAHAARFPRLAKQGFDRRAVTRIYDVLDAREKGTGPD